MLSIDARLEVVFCAVWAALPAVKSSAFLTAIGLEDLGAKHGSFNPDTGTIVLNTRLLLGATPQEIPLFDINGDSPPKRLPCISRIWHTLCHEVWHAIGQSTGLDRTTEWLDLSGFVEAPDTPNGTERYFESRPGWSPMGPSEWRYRLGGNFFPREYASRSPFECFADCCTHITLGWTSFFNAPPPYTDNALAKLAYLRRHVWGELGVGAVHAAHQRWHARHGLKHALSAQEEDDDSLVSAIAEVNEDQKRHVLVWLSRRRGSMFDHDAAVTRMAYAIGPWMLKAYRSETALAPDRRALTMVQRAAESYISTTERWIEEAITKDVPRSALPALIEQVYTRSNTARAQQLAETERYRMTQAAREAAWQTEGDVAYKVWRTHSAKPCSFCLTLDGRRIAVGETFFRQGETLVDAAGKKRLLDYEDIYHPPLHGHCACSLEPA